MHNNLGRLGGQLGVMLCLLGFLVIFFGWNGAASQDYVPAQFPYLISGGIAGVFILGLGALCWLSADLRDEWTKLDRIEDALNRLADTGLVDLKASEEQQPQSQSQSRNLVEA